MRILEHTWFLLHVTFFQDQASRLGDCEVTDRVNASLLVLSKRDCCARPHLTPDVTWWESCGQRHLKILQFVLMWHVSKTFHFCQFVHHLEGSHLWEERWSSRGGGIRVAGVLAQPWGFLPELISAGENSRAGLEWEAETRLQADRASVLRGPCQAGPTGPTPDPWQLRVCLGLPVWWHHHGPSSFRHWMRTFGGAGATSRLFSMKTPCKPCGSDV